MSPMMGRQRQKIKQMDRINLMEWAIILMVVVLALAAIVAAVSLSSWGGAEVKEASNVKFNQDFIPKSVPLKDTDSDGLGDIEENYKYGTNITNPDTDGDGIGDWWEVTFGVRDPKTNEWNVDPNDPTDAYQDPDNDGYDYNHNGYIDGSDQDKGYSGFDWVYLSSLKVAAHTEYTTYNLNQLLSNQLEHRGELVRISGARVVDNGSYEYGLGTEVDREITINITDGSTNQQLAVLLQARCNRPVNLLDDSSGIFIPADVVDVQGIFEGSGIDWRISIRGTEKFTNLMEYLSARDYDNLGGVNWTSPNEWDSDGDGMSDGWEIHYGQGLVNTSKQPAMWEWIVHLDPTWGGDSAGEGSPDTDIDQDRIQVPDPLSGEMKWVGYNRDEYLTVLDNDLYSMMPRNRLNLADLLNREDIPRSMYAYGMNPAMADTDMDSFDIDNDGYTPGVDTNTNDFNEIFFSRTDPTNHDTDFDTMWDGWEIQYGLNATNPNDRFEDSDGDLLQNYQEFHSRTNPRRWDTDDEGLPRKNPAALFDDKNDPNCFDGMPDGWEVFYGLDPLDRADQSLDSDVIDIAGVPVSRPDGLINLFEYRNNTDPKLPDTDGDHLSDYEEVALGWDVRVNSKLEHYFTCASKNQGIDTDKDTALGPPLWDGSPPGPAGTEFLNPGDPDTRHDLNDWNEVTYYRTNASNPDTDGEGLSDGLELFTDRDPNLPGQQATDPTLADTDGDGLNDYIEVTGLKLWLPGIAIPQIIVTSPLRLDTDNDGLKDGDEVQYDFLPRDVSGKTQTYIVLRQDTDGYFMPVYEPDIGKRVDTANPNDPDTDHDGIPDGFEFDNSDPDCDGLPTWWEVEFGFGRLNPFKQDTDDNGIEDMIEDFDMDGLNNLEEFRHRTDPTDQDSACPGLERPVGVPNPKSRARNGIKDGDEGGLLKDKSLPFKDVWGHNIMCREPVYSDSDGDLMPDWWEILHKLNPRANDSWDDKDSDGFANLDEYIYGTNPEVADTNGNGVEDWKDHPMTYSRYAVDRDGNGIGDWWEKFWFGGPCDPNGNADGPWDPETNNYGDNWTNFQEWYNSPEGWENNLFRTSPVLNDTDGDGMNDDFDPYPAPITYVAKPMGKTDAGASMNPVRPDSGEGDMDNDGLSNIDEYKYPFGTLDPTDPDSDQDTMPDGYEVAMGIPVYNNTENGTGKVNGSIQRIMDPLVGPDDTLEDGDIDGVNYSLKWIDKNENKWPDSGEFIITEYDANQDGRIDPFFENESFSNVEEYWFGRDCDADGINENVTYPFKNDTDEDGMLDGYEVGFSDSDGDTMPNLWELRYGLNPLDPDGVNGTLGDPDDDGYSNIEEYYCHTNPRDPLSYPGGLGRGTPRRADPAALPDDYHVAVMVESWLLEHPRVYDPSFLQSVQRYLWNYRKDL
ncbi:MAG: hypothetical protein FJ149_05430 [Euryarchaeota archaeon]|nr:hypothetical protein [Euryarchaeota archaeon]